MLFEIQEKTKNLSCYSLMEYLVNDRFKGKTIVTASLRARSIVVLQMLADINPATPVVFCHAGTIFPESVEYKEYIVDRLGLTDIREPQKKESEPMPGDQGHLEWLKENYHGSTVKRAIHLNKSLAGFECWISAVYHNLADGSQMSRIDVEGKVLRVNPLLNWSQEQVAKFMKVHALPFHKLAPREPVYQKTEDGEEISFYSY
jgi:phosphoadenosine phosphosulfate reductase